MAPAKKASAPRKASIRVSPPEQRSPPEPATEPDQVSASEALQYATAWFLYHAQQRTQTFNFFLVVEAALIAAFGSQYGDLSGFTLGFIATAGALAPIPFLMLEIRNTELVNGGRTALDELEETYLAALPQKSRPRYRDQNRFDLVRSAQGWFRTDPKHRRQTALLLLKEGSPQESGPKPQWLVDAIRHGFVFRSLLTLAFVAWMVLAVYCFVWYRETPRGAIPARGAQSSTATQSKP